MNITFLAAKMKFPNTYWLTDVDKDTMRLHTEYMLGEEVAGLRVHGSEGQITYRPDWKTVLLFGYEVRKWAARLVMMEEMKWGEALAEARREGSLKQKYLLTNMTLDVISRVVTGQWKHQRIQRFTEGRQAAHSGRARFRLGIQQRIRLLR